MNRSRVVLLDSTFSAPPEISMKPDTVVYYARLLELNGSGEANVHHGNGKVMLDGVRVPRKKGIVLEVAHDGGLD